MTYTSNLTDWAAPSDDRVEQGDWFIKKDEPFVAEYLNHVFYELIKESQWAIDRLNAIDPDEDGQVEDAYAVQGKTPEQLGGFKHVQTATPDANAVGESWLKNANNLLFTYDGERYEIQREVGYDETLDFSGENGFTVTHESPVRTKIEGGSIMLIDEQVVADFEDGNVTPEHSAWSWSAGSSYLSAQNTQVISGSYSLQMESPGADATSTLTRDLAIIQDWEFSVQIGADTSNINDFTRFAAYDGAGNRIAAIQFNDGAGNVELIHGGGTTEIMAGWTADTTYSFEFDWNFANGDFDLIVDGAVEGTFAVENAASDFKEFNIRNNAVNSGANRAVFADDFHSGAREAGEVVISCPEPDARIEGWDVLRFERTLANESVVVDVEDESGNVLVSDISSNDDLSAAASSATNPQIRVSFTRTDTTNTPSFDYLYRRWFMRPGDNGVNIRAFGSGGEDNVHEINFTAPVMKDEDGRVTVDFDPRYVNVTGDSMSGDLDVNATVSVGDDLILDDDDGAQYVVVGKDTDSLTIAEVGGSAFESMEVNARQFTKQGYDVWHDGNKKGPVKRMDYMMSRLGNR